MIQAHRLHFTGDSITDAFRRPEEDNEAFRMGNGYVFLAVAKMRFLYPDWQFSVENTGIAGQAIQDLEPRWEREVLNTEPDFVTLHIGINDVIRGIVDCRQAATIRAYEDRLRCLIEKTYTANPSVRFALGEPFLLATGQSNPQWQASVAALSETTEKVASSKEAVFLPFGKKFSEACARAPAGHWSYDGIHPNPAGFQLMADLWLDTVLPLVNLLVFEASPV